MIKRVILIIIDACGVGEMQDATEYGDSGAATIPNVARAVGGLAMPNCQKLGLGNIVEIAGIAINKTADGCWGRMVEKSPGKDSTTGHWEIGGIILSKPFPLFPDGFPQDLVREFEQRAKVKTIGNKATSGTEIIKELGERHLKTKEIILYTSADSVFQLAAHEEIYPLERLYEICRIAREMLSGEYAVGRVIARPFVGTPGNFTRTAGRRDFSLEPPEDTILDVMVKNGFKTIAIGKIWDLFAGRGITDKVKTANNNEVMAAIIDFVKSNKSHDMAFANLVDFDMLWGHRRDVDGFANGLEAFDHWLGNLLPLLRNEDILIITADHGCDPTFGKHTDHTREYVPLLVYGEKAKHGVDLGTRATFADVACTLGELFEIENRFKGKSFYSKII
ncbi:MAG: phosphopentomutase [Candidatus Zixiibacteriota bacterium]